MHFMILLPAAFGVALQRSELVPVSPQLLVHLSVVSACLRARGAAKSRILCWRAMYTSGIL